MSFGFGVGDFIAVSVLIKGIVSSLKACGGSASAYQEVQLELSGLQSALTRIEHLKGISAQTPAINAIKVAALNSQYVLQEFRDRLQKYETSLERGMSRGRMMDSTKKIQWELLMKSEVQEFRTYLVAHTNSLNMRLIVEGLATASTILEEAETTKAILKDGFDQTQQKILNVHADVKEQGRSVLDMGSVLHMLIGLVTSELIPRLDTLIDLANKVWSFNMNIISVLIKAQVQGPSPDIEHTWAQAPVKFEDALGRIIPIPSEFDWPMVDAVIFARFLNGPGRRKVLSGEYELIDDRTGKCVVREPGLEFLLPGASIVMAIILGQYGEVDVCPRLGCPRSSFTTARRPGKTCTNCLAWFGRTNALPRPVRPPEIIPDSVLGTRAISEMGLISNLYEFMRKERRCFKNIRIYVTKLPDTPTAHKLNSSNYDQPWSSYAISERLKLSKMVRSNLPIDGKIKFENNSTSASDGDIKKTDDLITLLIQEINESNSRPWDNTRKGGSIALTHRWNMDYLNDQLNGRSQSSSSQLASQRPAKKTEDVDGLGLMFSAVRNGNIAVVQHLLDGGFDINARTPYDGWTALHWAAHKRNKSMASLLIKYGADATIKSKHEEQTALDLNLAATFGLEKDKDALFALLRERGDSAIKSD